MRDIKDLDLNLLKALDVLLDERSVTRAAARLSLTQPAVSGILTRLRDSFGDPLLVRSPRGMVPTLRALELAEPVKRILADVGGLLDPGRFDPASADFTVRLAATDYGQQAVILPLLAMLRMEAPGIRIAAPPLGDSGLLERLERGKLDIALVTPLEAMPDLHMRALYEESYVCAMRADHPVADGPLTLERFCALDHALVSFSGAVFEGVTDKALAELGLRRRVVLATASFLALREALFGSDLVAVVPRRLVAGYAGLVLHPLPLVVPGFTKAMVWHERTHRDAGHRWVRQRLLDACGAMRDEGSVDSVAGSEAI